VAWLAGAALLLGVASAAADPDVAAAPPRAHEDAMPGGVPFEERLAEIRRRIQEALVYPPLARRRSLEGESEVAFEIAPGGAPSAIELVRSSGSTLLDAAAERAVRAAAPLPPVLGRLRVPVRFELDERSATAP
jgi:TonB family protein